MTTVPRSPSRWVRRLVLALVLAGFIGSVGCKEVVREDDHHPDHGYHDHDHDHDHDWH